MNNAIVKGGETMKEVSKKTSDNFKKVLNELLLDDFTGLYEDLEWIEKRLDGIEEAFNKLCHKCDFDCDYDYDY
jgi:hypothetical protein